MQRDSDADVRRDGARHAVRGMRRRAGAGTLGVVAEERRTGIFLRLSPATGSAGGALAGGLSALEEVFNPGARRAREELERQHELVMPTPSPGDRMLADGVVVIPRPEARADDAEGIGGPEESGGPVSSR